MQAFANKFDVKDKDLRKDHHKAVPKGVQDLIGNHTQLDRALYHEASRIFWARVIIMENVTGRVFEDVPPEYRRTGY